MACGAALHGAAIRFLARGGRGRRRAPRDGSLPIEVHRFVGASDLFGPGPSPTPSAAPSDRSRGTRSRRPPRSPPSSSREGPSGIGTTIPRAVRTRRHKLAPTGCSSPTSTGRSEGPSGSAAPRGRTRVEEGHPAERKPCPGTLGRAAAGRAAGGGARVPAPRPSAWRLRRGRGNRCGPRDASRCN